MDHTHSTYGTRKYLLNTELAFICSLKNYRRQLLHEEVENRYKWNRIIRITRKLCEGPFIHDAVNAPEKSIVTLLIEGLLIRETPYTIVQNEQI